MEFREKNNATLGKYLHYLNLVVYYVHMAGKESFNQRISLKAQQIERQRKIDKENQKRQDLLKKRQAEQAAAKKKVDQEKKRQERIRKTKENFRGTGILETFQEIRKNQILVYSRHMESEKVNTLFGSKYTEKEKVKLASVRYNINEVKLFFDRKIRCGTGEFDQDYEVVQNITVSKENKKFRLSTSLKYPRELDSFEVVSNNPNKIIDGIAEIIALKQSVENN